MTGEANDLMHVDMLGMVAGLVEEFPDLPVRSVVRSVRQSVDQLPAGSAELIMGAARVKLEALRESGPSV